jgi:hypothetical protein
MNLPATSELEPFRTTTCQGTDRPPFPGIASLSSKKGESRGCDVSLQRRSWVDVQRLGDFVLWPSA